MHHLNTIAFATSLPLLLLLFVGSASAQGDTTRTIVDTSTAPVLAATTAANEETGYRMTKSPTAAVLFSIVPGGGQLYNGQPIKAGLFAGVAGYFAFQVIRYHTRFREKADEVDALPLDDSTGLRDFRKREREIFRDNRDLNGAYYIGVTLLSMIDAYVGAHLFDFDVDDSEDGLSSRLYLDPTRTGVGLMLRW